MNACTRVKKEWCIPFGFVSAFLVPPFLSFPAVSVLDPVFLRVDLGLDSGTGSGSAVESDFRSLVVVMRFL